ncbi:MULTISPECIES: hypothetical protein [unclassified Sporosarcina]|uniref:hypothetical protein n=1 Tax=unclassified Sporosarcina TaxID=2647733 RepID=UPI00057B29E8|nr:hypothetical protein [Sporosarcina sp. ZBG7A]
MQFTKKLGGIFILVLILLSSYMFFIYTPNIESRELVDFDTVKPNSFKKITNQSDIKTIKKSIRRAKRISGVADMADPTHILKIKNKEYYLWIHENSKRATVMKKSNTHTVYVINSAEEIYRILN